MLLNMKHHIRAQFYWLYTVAHVSTAAEKTCSAKTDITQMLSRTPA